MEEVFDAISYLAGKGHHGKPVSGGEVVYACFFACGKADDDRKKKLYVNAGDGFYHCKVCGEQGGTTLLQRHFGDNPQRDVEPQDDPYLHRRIRNWAADVGAAMLSNNDEMLMYLMDERGLAPETILERKLGWVGKGWSLTGSLPEDFPKKALLGTGLVYRDGHKAGQDFFYNHILIPYVNHGNVVQIRGKVHGAKYFTGPGDPARIFNTDDLEDAEDVVITEGEFDAMVLKQHLQYSSDDRIRKIGVVGLPGAKKLSDDQLKYFASPLIKRIYIALDPDDVGKRVAVELKEQLGTRARILELPSELPKCDWTDYLLPVPAGADAKWHLAHPHAGHDWRDVAALLGNASGKRIYSMRESGLAYRNQRDDGVMIKTGFLQLDATIGGMKPGQVMVVLAKAQPNSEPVLTPGGWVPIGGLRSGDLVYDASGREQAVLGVFPQGVKEIFQITFSDGAVVRSTGDHLWTWRHNTNAAWKTTSLEELAAATDHQRGCMNPHYKQVPVVEPVQLPETDLPLDAYTLGVLIGDGSFRKPTPRLTTDCEIVDGLLLPDGVVPKYESPNGPGVADYGLSAIDHVGNPLTDVLRDLGLQGHLSVDKFVPRQYLLASVAQRWALLQGLLDTDGTVEAGGTTPSYSTGSLRLAHDVVELVRSLGGVASVRVGPVNGKDYYKVNPSLPNLGNPFRLSRKADRWRPNKHAPTRTVRQVERCGTEEATCIRVSSPRQLYVTSDYVLTHNTGTGKTVLLCNMAYNMRASKVLLISLEMTREEVYERLRRIFLFHSPLVSDVQLEDAMSNVWICDENRLGERDLNQLVDEFEIEAGERPDVVMVDYLGYYARGAPGNSPYEKTTNAVMQLKAEAKAGRFVCISPAQVNRGTKEGKPIDLDDARDSGAIEETADFLCSIWRPDDALMADATNMQQSGKVKLTILKSRHGGKDRTFTLVMDLLTLAMVDDGTQAAKRCAEHNYLSWRGDKWEDLRRVELQPVQQTIAYRRDLQ